MMDIKGYYCCLAALHTDYMVSLGFITKITVPDLVISKVLRHLLYPGSVDSLEYPALEC